MLELNGLIKFNNPASLACDVPILMDAPEVRDLVPTTINIDDQLAIVH